MQAAITIVSADLLNFLKSAEKLLTNNYFTAIIIKVIKSAEVIWRYI